MTPKSPESATERQFYRFTIWEDEGGWWRVQCRYGTKASVWTTVARVFGERRAEIVRDALSAEANERV